MGYESLIFYRSWRDAIEVMTPEDQLTTFRAICDFALDGTERDLTGIPYAVFTVAKPSIIANQAKREGGKLGGRPPKATGNANKTKGFVNKETIGFVGAETIGCEKGESTDTDTGTDTVTEIDKDAGMSLSSEPVTASEAIIALPLNDGSEYSFFQSDVDELQALYPAVDVLQAMRSMRGWCISNPAKRKTRRGVRRFVNSWLAREQDRGGAKSPRGEIGRSPQKSYTIPTDDDYLAWRDGDT